MLNIENYILKKVNKCKYLGLIIDERLKFNYHIAYITRLLSFKTGILLKLRKEKVPLRIHTLLYNSLMLPHIYYCHVIWSHTYDVHLKPLQKVLKTISYILGNNYKNRLLLSNLSNYCNILFFVRILKNPKHCSYNTLINDINLIGRHKFNLKLKHANENIRLKTSFINGRIIYNEFINKYQVNPFIISKSQIKILSFN